MKRKSEVPLITGFVFFILLFIFAEAFTKGIANGISNCFKIIIPSLFPFLIASSVAGYGNISATAKKYIEPLTQKLFRLPAESITAILLGLFGGYLSGAKAIESMHSNGILTKSQSKRALCFCINAGMGFAVNAVGNGLLFSRKAGRVLLFSLCVSSILTGIISGFFVDKTEEAAKIKPKIRLPFSSVIVKSVKDSTLAMLYACGFVVMFSGICEIFSVNINNEIIRTVLTCVFEVTGGCIEIVGKTSLAVIAFVCAFGGICVHMQIFSMLQSLEISMLEFYAFRLLHSGLAYIICSITLIFYPVEMPVFLSFSQNVEMISFSVPATVSLFFLCVLLILDLDNSREIC